jgi:hypothetical protein
LDRGPNSGKLGLQSKIKRFTTESTEVRKEREHRGRNRNREMDQEWKESLSRCFP